MVLNPQSTATEVKSFQLLKPSCREAPSRGGALTSSFLSVDWDEWAKSVDSRKNWKDLASVDSKMHETRGNYLKVKVLDNYYVLDEDIRNAYFEYGTVCVSTFLTSHHHSQHVSNGELRSTVFVTMATYDVREISYR